MPSPQTLHRLPLSAYTSEDWFEREQADIFSKTWAYAGFAEDVSEPGVPLIVQAGLNSLFVVRGTDGVLRAFHNICRHRGTQLLRTAGKSEQVITCPYHDWTYDLEGALIAVPDEEREFPGGVDKSCLGLKPAAVGIWRGMVFVHPEPVTAPSLDQWFGPMERKLGPHDVEALPEFKDGHTSYEIRANWKVVVENFMDVYHLSHLHSGTLTMYDHARAEFGFVGPHFAFREPLSRDYAEDLERNTPYPLIIDKADAAAWVPMLFPGIGLVESESAWTTFIITPLAADVTRVENRVRVADKPVHVFARQAAKSARFWARLTKAKVEGADKSHPLGSADFTAEDIYACEQAQKSFTSPHFEVGPAGKGEQPILDHQGVVLSWMDGSTDGVTTTPAAIANASEAPPQSAPAATLTVEWKGKAHEVPVRPNQTLLKASKDALIDPPFSCQAGICGTCRAELLEGEVAPGRTAALTDEEKQQGQILTCQARARSERLRIRLIEV